MGLGQDLYNATCAGSLGDHGQRSTKAFLATMVAGAAYISRDLLFGRSLREGLRIFPEIARMYEADEVRYAYEFLRSELCAGAWKIHLESSATTPCES